jgi:putative membrane protein
MMWGGGSGGFGMMFGFVFMLILIAAVVIGTILLLRHFGIGGNDSQTDAAAGRMRAMDILEERYAKGEIDSKEFEERKAKLSG